MSQANPNSPTAKPYKGPESYQVEDTALFFGRDDDANQLIATILAARFTLLHAQSGAGKTSLLNARIIPGLEARGWNAYRILPQNDPVESIREATFRYILPSPRAELVAIQRAWEALVPDKKDLTLSELLSAYDALEIRDPRRRALVKRVAHRDEDAAPVEIGLDDPYFCRLLRSSIEPDVFAEHIAVVQQTPGGTILEPTISLDSPLRDVVSIVGDPALTTSYNKLVNELKVPGRSLRVFFEHLVETYGSRRTRFGLVLILDQFEEIFTRFVDPGVTVTEYVADLPDWRLRWELFDQLKDLCVGEATPEDVVKETVDATTPVLPIRYVVSMRDEYIAQMDPVRRFVTELENSSYHLKLLEKRQAQDAIQEPAKIFGYTYQPACFKRIIQQLTKEDRFVEPAHLQLVCDKLWNEKGRELASVQTPQATGESSLLINEEVFEGLGETKGILKSFFTDFLEGLPQESRQEILEMLEPLVTASGTRNIIERERLVNAPFRDSRKRKELLDLLVNHTIIRTEPRLGGYFVEITHEFLIGPILEQMSESLSKDPEYGRFRLARRSLERLRGSSIAGTAPDLTHQEFFTLHRHLESIRWDAWSSELMLRCAVAYGATKEVLKTWLEAFHPFERVVSASAILDEMKESNQPGEFELLRLGELRLVNNERRSLTLSKDDVELIWRSELCWAKDSEREDVQYWTERMKWNG